MVRLLTCGMRWGGANQRFTFEDQGNGSYAIRAEHSDKYLDIYGGNTGDGGRVIQYRWTGAANQLWYLQRDSDGDYIVLSCLSNRALDISGGGRDAGNPVITYRYQSQLNQKWSFVRSDPKPSVVGWSKYGVASSDVESGDYIIGAGLPGRYVTMSGGMAVSSRAQVGKGQLFHIAKMPDGSYSLTDKDSGKVLAVSSTKVQSGMVPVWKTLDESDRTQRWCLYKSYDSSYYLSPAVAESQGMVLDVLGGDTGDGVTLDLWSISGGINQRFHLLRESDLSGSYVVSSEFAHDMVLDVPGGSTYPDTGLEIWSMTGGMNQLFEFVRKGNGWYSVRVRHSGMVLDIHGGNSADGAQVIQYPWIGGSNQLWYPRKNVDGSYTLMSALNGKVLDIAGGQSTRGGHVIMYHENRQTNQKWKPNKE